MISESDAWAVAQEAAQTNRTVCVTMIDDKKFYGVLSHVDWDYIVVNGWGFPLEDIRRLETTEEICVS